MEECFVLVMTLIPSIAVLIMAVIFRNEEKAIQDEYSEKLIQVAVNYKKRMKNIIMDYFNDVQELEDQREKYKTYANELNVSVSEMLDAEKERKEKLESKLACAIAQIKTLQDELEIARMEAEWYREQLKEAQGGK